MSDTSPTPPRSPAVRTPWLQTLRVYLEPASLRMLTLGFSAGLPLLLVLGTLSFRLREAGIDRSTIGYLSWVGLAYGFKWLWAPLVDRMPLPLLTRWLGRRRSWLLLSQGMVVAGLVGMALADPRLTLGPIVWCALAVAFGSATQDIALDAFRIESADSNHQAALAPAASKKARRADQGDERATPGVGQKRHIQETPGWNEHLTKSQAANNRHRTIDCKQTAHCSATGSATGGATGTTIGTADAGPAGRPGTQAWRPRWRAGALAARVSAMIEKTSGHPCQTHPLLRPPATLQRSPPAPRGSRPCACTLSPPACAC